MGNVRSPTKKRWMSPRLSQEYQRSNLMCVVEKRLRGIKQEATVALEVSQLLRLRYNSRERRRDEVELKYRSYVCYLWLRQVVQGYKVYQRTSYLIIESDDMILKRQSSYQLLLLKDFKAQMLHICITCQWPWWASSPSQRLKLLF